MATPSVDATSTLGWQSAGTSITVTKPTGTVENDLLVAIVFAYNGSTATIPSDEAGWTTEVSASLKTVALKVYYKIAGGSEPADYTFDNAASDEMSAVIYRISGHDPGAPISASDTGTEDAGDDSPTYSVSLNTVLNDSLLIMAAVGNDDGTAASYTVAGISNPSWTEVFDDETAAKTAASAHAVSGEIGTISSFGLTWTSSGNIDDSAGVILTLAEQKDDSAALGLVNITATQNAVSGSGEAQIGQIDITATQNAITPATPTPDWSNKAKADTSPTITNKPKS